jgi:uncharacterized integral membrane protein (TIGR00697 family)
MISKKNVASNTFLVLAMLFLALILLTHTFANKELLYPLGGISSPGMLTFPLAFMVLDIIAEIYGFHTAKQVIWATLAISGFFFFAGAMMAYFPDPNNIPNLIPGQYYQAIFGILPRVYIATFIGMLLGSTVNAKLLSKWRILLKGKYFWARSLGASAIGDFIFIFVGTFLICLERFPFYIILKFSLTAYLIEICALIILAPFASIVTSLIKLILRDKASSLQIEYNPFSLEN